MPIGIVQLDSCCMHGPSAAGGVAPALEGVRVTAVYAACGDGHDGPPSVVGPALQPFAADGLQDAADDLNTDASRAQRLESGSAGPIRRITWIRTRAGATRSVLTVPIRRRLARGAQHGAETA